MIKIKSTSQKSKVVISHSPGETLKAGEELAKKLKPGSFVALTGDLGSGKTIFTKGIAKGLGVKDFKYVNSPTFVILKKHNGRIPLYHFDIYRLDSGGDLDSVGYEEYFYGKGVTVVE
ncbi:MAG: tRNA (adenosine(37)-N6)-threonylcarbamoyltransferase complex ATPase subunit type 1 TsaE, partial [Candidatus Omnitrophica bacterium]|nr:tRNA (adenosine(37)-N6)-threonylcarbamoyltransferase complex ATPase subunit type 1 TsaE [Candidatus Omnitrophota bacterium]